MRQHPDNAGGLGALLMLPAKVRIVAGILLAVVGAVLAVVLWNRGVVAGATIFAVVLGFFLAWSGVSSQRRESRQQAQRKSVASRQEEILEDMVALKRSGGNPVRYLNEQGIQDAEIRATLLEEMKQRLAASK